MENSESELQRLRAENERLRRTLTAERQEAIERKLAARHLKEGALALYDLSSSYFEGTHCPLGKIGHNRDGKKNKLQVNYGLLTNRAGCPVALSVYEGNTGVCQDAHAAGGQASGRVRARAGGAGRRSGHDLTEGDRAAA